MQYDLQEHTVRIAGKQTSESATIYIDNKFAGSYVRLGFEKYEASNPHGAWIVRSKQQAEKLIIDRFLGRF